MVRKDFNVEEEFERTKSILEKKEVEKVEKSLEILS